jgi:hypothetical protein
MIDKNSDASINAGFGSRNQTSEAALDGEREPMPDQTPDTNSNHPKIPPARNGSISAAQEDRLRATRSTIQHTIAGISRRP